MDDDDDDDFFYGSSRPPFTDEGNLVLIVVCRFRIIIVIILPLKRNRLTRPLIQFASITAGYPPPFIQWTEILGHCWPRDWKQREREGRRRRQTQSGY